MQQINTSNVRQHGAVSLFIVIFTALLLTTVTISFMQLMVKDQQQASYSDLSESAYDSAVAGVEDAKRALLINQGCAGQSTRQCTTVKTAIAAGNCNTLSTIFGNATDPETKIEQTTNDQKLEQAYTCVKITPDTSDFLGTMNPDTSPTIIPLRGKVNFSKVVISWNQSKTGGKVNLPRTVSDGLPAVGSAWPETRPALLRAQFINGGSSFKLSDLDSGDTSSTLFLYPSQTGLKTANFSIDSRRASSNAPQPIQCTTTAVPSGAYACKAEIDLGATVSAGSGTAFLSLAAFYNPTDYKVELEDATGKTVLFDSVQPEVDSTGRANDLFRRVVSRVELDSTFNYPVAALETSGNICKNFSVTTDAGDYVNNCTP